MEDYSRLYPSRFRTVAKTSKLSKIRKLLLSGLPPEVLLLLIAAIVLPKEVFAMFKR
jgi:hypothetical protein